MSHGCIILCYVIIDWRFHGVWPCGHHLVTKITFPRCTQPERLRVNNHSTTMVTFVKELNNKIEKKTLAGLILLLFIISFANFLENRLDRILINPRFRSPFHISFHISFTLVATLYPLSEVRWVFWDILALDLR